MIEKKKITTAAIGCPNNRAIIARMVPKKTLSLSISQPV
jgi:hypothetical protein